MPLELVEKHHQTGDHTLDRILDDGCGVARPSDSWRPHGTCQRESVAILALAVNLLLALVDLCYGCASCALFCLLAPCVLSSSGLVSSLSFFSLVFSSQRFTSLSAQVRSIIASQLDRTFPRYDATQTIILCKTVEPAFYPGTISVVA